jgi:hypothetical protein
MTLAKIAQSLTAMMDGFWVEYLICAGRYTPDDAVKKGLQCFSIKFFFEFKNA